MIQQHQVSVIRIITQFFHQRNKSLGGNLHRRPIHAFGYNLDLISEIAKERGIPHAVDNTFLTPYYQQPLKLGADLSVHSTTKYLDGHNATVGGAVVSRTAEQDEKMRFIQNASAASRPRPGRCRAAR